MGFLDSSSPTRVRRMGPLSSLDVFLAVRRLFVLTGFLHANRSPLRSKTLSLGRDAAGLFHDREAHASLVAVLFRDHAPGIFGLLAGRERALDLGRAVHERVEVHRTELAANHPVITAVYHDSLLYSAAWM